MAKYLQFLESRIEYNKDFNIFFSFAFYDKYFKSFTLPKTIQVIGTNAKGSTSRYLALMLRKAGFSVGHFSSPHIFSFNERFWLDEKLVSDACLDNAHDKLKGLVKDDLNKLSYFEYATFLIPFVFAKCDYIILEAGLGGEYDSTSVFKRDLCVITPIGMDHQEVLGNTLEKIARTKLKAVNCEFLLAANEDILVQKMASKIALLRGLLMHNEKPFIKPLQIAKNIDCLQPQIKLLEKLIMQDETIVAKNLLDVSMVKKLEALKQNLRLLKELLPKNEEYFSKKSDLKKLKNLQSKTAKLPSFLQANFNLALNAFYLLTKSLPKDLVSLDLRARCERLTKNIFIDTGHNEMAAKALSKEFDGKKLILIYNAYADKDSLAILQSLKPIIKEVRLQKIINPTRKMLNEDLFKLCEKLNLSCFEYDAKKGFKEDEIYLVFGGFLSVQNFLRGFNEGV